MAKDRGAKKDSGKKTAAKNLKEKRADKKAETGGEEQKRLIHLPIWRKLQI